MLKETQNKWEKTLKEDFYQPTIEKEEKLKSFISRIENEAFERGKEETYSGSMVYKLGARETLEEVEREIKENFNNQNSMTITYYDLLQTINKMKTN